MVGSSMNLEDGATREEVEEALMHLSKAAQALPQGIGNSQWTSPWDKLHERINELLDVLEEYKVEVA